MRTILLTLAAAALLSVPEEAWARQAAGSAAPPPPIQRGQPGEAHEALQPLIGRWRVEKTSRFPGVAPNGPVTSTDLTAVRAWIGDGRFIQERVDGRMGDNPYFRQGLLGYSTMDRRYEWVTVDNTNANMMIYLGHAGTGPARPIQTYGTFTDQGLLGADAVGNRIAMRTEIIIEGPDRNRLRLYVTPEGGEEYLADEMIFTRLP